MKRLRISDRKFEIAFITAILVFHSSPGMGAPVIPEKLSLSLEDAMRYAMDRNPELLRAKAKVDAARRGLLCQKGDIYPYVGINASISRGSPSSDSLMEVEARQMLFRFGELWPGLDQAREAERDARISYELVRLQVADMVRRCFWNLLITQEEIREREEIAAEIESRLSRMRERAKEGLVLKVDLLNVELELEEQKLKVNELKRSMALETIKLLRSIGIEGSLSLELVGEIPEVRSDLSTCIAMGLSQRPEMHEIAGYIERQRTIVRNAWWRWISDLSISLGYGDLSIMTHAQGKSWETYMELRKRVMEGGFGSPSGIGGPGKIGISLSLPIFEGFKVFNQVAAERADLEAMDMSRKSLADRIEMEIREKYTEIGISKERVEIYRRRFEIAKELRDTIDLLIETELGPEAGVGRFRFISFDDAIRARADFANAQDAYFAQRRGYAMAVADLYRAVGVIEGSL